MLAIDNTLVSEDIFEKQFVCDLTACKGACCVLGDGGAPVEEDELDILDSIYEDVKPFLRDVGIAALEEQGTFVMEQDGSYATPLVNGAECAYTVFDEKGIALCGIEKAYRAGAVTWKKPISCELYPIRVGKLFEGLSVNYHKWEICKDACACGANLQVPVFRFLKDALTRKFGAEYYTMLEAADEYLKSQNA